MYITYCREQRTLNVTDTTEYRLNATSGEYRPTFLLRVSDWKKVPGKEAKNGYCALSYVWAQSGEVVPTQNGEYDLIDNGKHCIVEGHNIGKNKVFDKMKHRLLSNDERDSTTMIFNEEKNEYTIQFSPSKNSKATIRYVTYDELLQQICKDYQIDYLWYDKVCIDQSNKEIKHREIKQMHLIYGNARYTVAMVPELFVDDPDAFDMINPMSPIQDKMAKDMAWNNMNSKSLWWKRSWTLEETMSSKRILVLGADTHLWQHSAHTCKIPTSEDDFSGRLLDFANQFSGLGGTVNQALSEAHYRTSTKEHDKVFSLANVFHEKFTDLEINYKTDIKTALNQFYQTMAINDLSILCFGLDRNLHGLEFNVNTMRGHNLPSWTGVNGFHLLSRVTTSTTLLESSHTVDDDMLLRVSTKYYKTLSISPYDHGHFSKFSDDQEKLKHHRNLYVKRWELTVVGQEESDEDPSILTLIDWSIILFVFANINATHYHKLQENAPAEQIRPLSLTEDCEECIVVPILLIFHGIMRKNVDEESSATLMGGYHYYYFLPVLKKCRDDTTEEERYKAVGIYYLGHRDDGKYDSGYKGYAYLDSDDPEEILKTAFGEDIVNHEVKEFVIQ